jgi:hypothetical protein
MIEAAVLNRLRAMGRTGESYSDVKPRGIVKVDLRTSVQAFAAALAERLDALAAERSRPWWRRLAG